MTTVKELIDSGICPTCYDKENNNCVYGDKSDKMIFENELFECFLNGNPRAIGHTIINSKNHYKDMMEIPDSLCNEVYLFAKKMMNILKDVYKCESVYLCTMCDGPMNHFHVQLIPRYSYEERGSLNFVKDRFEYKYDEEKLRELRRLISRY